MLTKKFGAIHANIKAGTPTKQLPKQINIHGFASFNEQKLVVAEREEMVLEITPNMEFYVEVNDEMKGALCLKRSKVIIRAADEKSVMKFRMLRSVPNLHKLAKGWQMIELCGTKRYVLVFTESEFPHFMRFSPKYFDLQGGNVEREKIQNLAANSNFKEFFVPSSSPSIHGSKPPAAPEAERPFSRNIHIDSIELFPSTVSLSRCHIHVTPTAFHINLPNKITVNFDNVKSIDFEPGKDNGTPVNVTLLRPLTSLHASDVTTFTEIGFVLTTENLNNAHSLKNRFVNIPNVPYTRNCKFDFGTKKFERGGAVVVVDKEDEDFEVPPAPKSKPAVSKLLHAVTTVRPNAFALKTDNSGNKTLESSTTTAKLKFPFDALQLGPTTTAQMRVHGLAHMVPRTTAAARTYAAVTTTAATPKKRAKMDEEEEYDFIDSPFTPRRSARFSDKSPSNAQDAKILFFYPSTSEPSALRDLGFDTITMRAMDRACLHPGEYLNDSIMDFYGKFCFRERVLKSPALKNEVHLMSSFLFSRMDHKISKLRKKFNFTAKDCAEQRFAVYSRVRYWSRGVDLFQKRFLILPINKSLHWSVAIVRLDANVEDSAKPPQVTVYTLDSLGNFHNASYVSNVLLLYLEHEWRARALTLEQGKEWPLPARNVTISASPPPLEDGEDSDDCQIVEAPTSTTPPPQQEEDAFVVECPALSANKRVVPLKVPRQHDAFNCGVFALRNIEMFLKDYEQKIRTKEEDLFEDKTMQDDDAMVEYFKTVRFSNANQFRRNLTELLDKLTKAYEQK